MLSFLVFGLLGNAQNIDSVVTTSPILCNGGVGDITVYTDAIGPSNIVYDLLYLNSSGNWQSLYTPTFLFQSPSSFTISSIPGLMYRVRTFDPTTNVVIDSVDHMLVDPPLLFLDPVNGTTSTSTLCFNGNDGTATINMMGGTAPYTYLWSDGQTTQTAVGLSAGSYSCTVTDINGCVFTGNPISVTVNQPNSPVNPSLFTSITDVGCYGDSTGAISLTVSGGTSPYFYSWETGDTTSSVSGLSAGTYSVLVTDANGCSQGSFSSLSDSNFYNVTQPLFPISVSISSSNVSCLGGSDGNIILTTNGGTSGYSYAWSSGQSTSSINNIPAGTYTFIITDANFCTYQDSVIITEPSSVISSTTSSTDVSCFGYNDGSFSVTVNGGLAPYSYLWSNGSTTSSNNLVSPNIYSVTITDAFGCNHFDTVTVGEPNQITVSFSLDSINCPSGSDGILMAEGIGGITPYNYTWSTNNPNGITIQNDSTIEQVSAGTYTVVIDDNNSCSETFSQVVIDPDPISISGQVVDVACHGENSGSITTNIIGATPPYSFQWLPDSQTTSFISSVIAGTYTVNVNDANNCYSNNGYASATFIVNEPALPLHVTIDTNHVICFGQSNGSATAFPTGGVGPYTYLWSTSETTPTINNLSAGAYSVIVEDANFCQHTVFFDIIEPDALTLSSTLVNPSCHGYTNGTALVTPVGGNGSYTYLWSNGHTGQSITGLGAGPIGVTVTDGTNQCSASTTLQLSQPSPIVVSVTTTDNLCFGGSTGTANSQVTDPFAPFTYLWSTGDTTPNIANLSAGTYNLTVRNVSGCIQSDFYVNGNSNTSNSFDINDPLTISLTSVVTNITANGANDGTISVSASGGTAPYTYSWSGPNGFSSSLSSINSLVSGFYNLIVTDVYGCTYDEQFTINEPNCNIIIDTTYYPPLCHDDNAQELTWFNSGGVGPYTSELVDDNGSVWYGPNSGLNPVTLINTLPPGLYNLNVEDISGCFATINIPVINPDSLSIEFVANDVLCFGDNNGSISAIASGGTPLSTGSYNYLWSPNNQSSYNISNLIAGNYSVVVTDANNCQIGSSYTLNEPDQMIVDSIISTLISCNPGTDGSASIYLSGGVLPYSYNWTIPNSGIPQTTQTASQLSISGIYSVDVVDSNGCFISDNIFVNYAPGITLNDSVIQPLCYNDTNGIVYANVSGGSSPYTYSWSMNGVSGQFGTSNSFIADLSPATYSVIVEDALGCVDQFTTQIINPSLLSISTTVINVSLNGANNGSINTFVTGGTGPGTYSYFWNGPNGFTSTLANISSLHAGTYTLNVIDGNGCSSTFVEVINEPACNVNFDPTITFVTQPLCFGQTGQITWMANGGGQVLNPTTITNNSNSTILFNQSTLPNQIYNQSLSDGNYSLYVQDEYGCTDILNFTIQSPNLLSANVITDSVSCYGGNDGSMLLQGIGGTPPYFPNYGTNPNTGTPINENQLSEGTYIVSLADNNGCLSSPLTFSVDIFEPNQIIVNYSTNEVTCFGASDGEISLSISGGTSPYNYTWQGSLSNISTPIVSNLTANTYFVEVTDVNGCVSDPTITAITVPGPNSNLTVSINPTNASCFGFSDGSAQAFPTGGTAPYSYEWSNGETTQTISGLLSGSYTCIVTDANGCVNYAITNVGEPNEINVNLSTSNISCYGLVDGSAVVNPSGGTGTGFGVLWNIVNPNTGQLYNSLNVSNLNVGVYNVTVNDFSLPGCDVTKTFIISQPDLLQISTNIEQIVTCDQGSDGSVSVNIIGGRQPYTYNWSSSSNNSVGTTSLISNLSSDMYYIDVIDSSGCSISDSIFLNSNNPIDPNLTLVDVSCYGGNDGIAYSNPTGGTAPYTFVWSFTGSTSSSSSGLNATTSYSVQITDASNCPTISTIFTINQPDSISMFVSIDSVSCFQGTDGIIKIDSVLGGVGPYNYLWSNGQSDTLIDNLLAGSYTCVVTDAIGCIDSSNTFIVGEPNQLTAGISITSNYNGNNLSCYGDSTGELSGFGFGGNGNYTYLWSNGQVDQNIDSIPAGTYGLTVTDYKGCTATDLVTITNPDSISFNFSLSNYNGSNVSCYGFSDGTVDATISSSVPINFSTIVWTYSNGNLLSNLNINNDTSLIGISAGNYSISVSDINGCFASANINLSEPDLLTNNYTTDSITCYGGNDGVAYANPVGGTAPYQISWSTGSTNDTITGLDGFTQYFVQISDTNSCPMVLDTVVIPQPDSIFVTSIITTPTCYGINDGQIILTSVSGGNGPYTYLWNDSSASTGTILANINSGEYICTITDALGCSEDKLFLVDTVFAIDVSATLISDYNGVSIRCYGDTNASVLATTFGGTAPYTYLWKSGNDTLSTIDSLTNVGSGIYTVFAEDANGCDDFISITVEDPDSITANIITTDYNGFEVSCFGFNDGSVTADVIGGNGINFNTLLWNTGDTLLTVNNLVSGTYSYSIEDINGCNADAQVILSSPLALVLDLTLDSLSCYGDSDAFSTIDNLQNAITPLLYSWSNGQSTDTAFNLSSGIYTLTVTDDNNCSITNSTSIYEPDSLISDLIITSSYNGSNISCYGYSDGFASISSSGGVSPYLYSLDSNFFSTISNFNNLGAGNFEVITKDANGCVINNVITFISPDPISANLQVISNPSCNGVFNGSITSLTSGGTGVYSYTWSGSSDTSNVSHSLTEGIYSTIITDANGCVLNDTIVLDALYSLNANTSTNQVSCTGYSDGTASINVSNGTLPYSYLWDNGSTTSTIIGLFAGSYSVTVIDSNGCQITDTVHVTESDSVLVFTSIVSDLNCYSDSSGSISVSVNGGLGTYVYNWSNGDSTSTVSNLSANTYILSVIDSVGCIVTDTFNVDQPLPLTYNLTSSDITCFGFNDGMAEIQISGGTLPYFIDWTGPSNYISNNSMLDSLLNGTYLVSVVDNNGCDFNDTVLISEPLLLTSNVIVSDPLCHNSNDGSIIINISGGVGPYSSSYGQLLPSSIIIDSISYLNLSDNFDSLYVYDSNNCKNSFEVSIVAPTELSVYNLISVDPTCYNYSNGYVSMNAIGGTQPYNYQLLDVNSNIISTSSSNTNLSSGLYIYVVYDNNGCYDDKDFELSNPEEISVSVIESENVLCHGDNTGSLTIDVENYSGSYELVWTPSEHNSSTETIDNLPAGQYQLLIVDENSCSKLDSFTITQNLDLALQLDVYDASCKSNADGYVDLYVNGGVEPYTLYNNFNMLTDNMSSSFTISDLLTNNYSLSIVDNVGCSIDTSIFIDFDGGYSCIIEPTIVTPNFDNINDLWIPIEDLDVEIEVHILNRWGQKEYRYIGNSLMFTWDGIGNWGGSVRELPSADYYYIIKFNNDNYSDRTGVITLIR